MSITLAAQQAPVVATDRPSTNKDPIVATPLPEGEIELRGLLADVDAQLLELETEVKAWKQLRLSIVAYRGTLDDLSVPDFDRLIVEIDSANKRGDTAALNTSLDSLLEGFFSSLGSPGTFSFSGLSVRPQIQDVTVTTNAQAWSRKLQAPLKRYRENGFLQRHPEAVANATMDEPLGITQLGAADLSDIRQFTTASWKESQREIATLTDQWLTEIDQNIKATDARGRELRTRRAEIAKKLETPRVEINQLAIKLGLPLFCATVCVLFCIPLAARLLTKDTNADSILTSGILVEINTVLLLTMTILILGLAGKIQGEVLGTLLGGISGYVLNRIRQERRPAKEQETAD